MKNLLLLFLLNVVLCTSVHGSTEDIPEDSFEEEAIDSEGVKELHQRRGRGTPKLSERAYAVGGI